MTHGGKKGQGISKVVSPSHEQKIKMRLGKKTKKKSFRWDGGGMK